MRGREPTQRCCILVEDKPVLESIFYATILSGCVAAYLMYRRGESFGTIAKQALTNPVGSLVSEVKNAV